jgi:iron complex outermembrane receptor protein
VVQALGYTAGVATGNDPNDTRFNSILIRGFSPVYYLDGMQMPVGATNRAAPKPDFSLLERIEVLKGPSSSLYGQLPPGGMVNLVSKLPSAAPMNSVELQADSWGLARANFDIGGVNAITAFGLLSALLGDGIWDVLSWIALAAPVAVTAFCLSRLVVRRKA